MEEKITLYKRPTENAPECSLIKGFWINKPTVKTGSWKLQDSYSSIPEFRSDSNGDDYAVEIEKRGKMKRIERNKKSGLQVLLSDDNSIRNLKDPSILSMTILLVIKIWLQKANLD